MKKAVKINLVLLILLILFFILTSCKTKIQYVPIESVRTEYINKYMRDSIVHYDSIFVKEKGDSVWLEKYKYIYKDRIRTDTIMQVDSVQVPYPVKGDDDPEIFYRREGNNDIVQFKVTLKVNDPITDITLTK